MQTIALNEAEKHTDHIEAQRNIFVEQSVACGVDVGKPCELTALDGGDVLRGSHPARSPSPGFDFDKGQRLPVPGDNVQLTLEARLGAKLHIGIYNNKPAPLQEGKGYLFSQSANGAGAAHLGRF